MAEPLAQLLEDGVIDEVYTRLKTGKEAEIWLVRHAGEVVAAKVYKERKDRNFKNNAAYLEGRRVRNTRTQRAMDKGSRFGRASAEEAWKAKESEALHKLHAAGLRVPKPVMFYEGVLLMETVLDANGRPAPRLIEAAIPREKAAEWYADLRAQAIKMLTCDLIHGDLSPYNVLLAWNGPTIIDFPQVIGAAHNSQAERFFERDLEALRHFFAQHDPALAASAGDAREIWRAFVRRELTPDFVPTGKAPPPAQGHAHGRQEPRSEHRPDRRGPKPQPQPQPRAHGERPGGQRAQQPREHPDRRPPQGGSRQDGPRPQPHGERHGGPRPQPHQEHPDRRPPQGGSRQDGPKPQPHGERHGGPRPHGERQPRQGEGGGPPREQQQPPRHPRPEGQPRRDERRPERPPRSAPPGPQVTVVQRIPGVAPALPKREGAPGGERQGGGQRQGGQRQGGGQRHGQGPGQHHGGGPKKPH
jgi:RIO kinase 1